METGSILGSNISWLEYLGYKDRFVVSKDESYSLQDAVTKWAGDDPLKIASIQYQILGHGEVGKKFFIVKIERPYGEPVTLAVPTIHTNNWLEWIPQIFERKGIAKITSNAQYPVLADEKGTLTFITELYKKVFNFIDGRMKKSDLDESIYVNTLVASDNDLLILDDSIEQAIVGITKASDSYNTYWRGKSQEEWKSSLVDMQLLRSKVAQHRQQICIKRTY